MSLRCPVFQELIDFEDGRLDREKARLIERHLATGCPGALRIFLGINGCGPRREATPALLPPVGQGIAQFCCSKGRLPSSA